jgi:hypothetical protein
MAASHVTGLAALILAHRPEFQGLFRARNADRVDRLFQILRASGQPINLGDPRRTGYGIPDVLVALGMAPPIRSVLQPVPGFYANRGIFAGGFPLGLAGLAYARYPELFAGSGLGPVEFGQSLEFAQNSGSYQHLVPAGTW